MVTKVEAIYYPDGTTKCERPLFMVPVTAGFPSPAEDYEDIEIYSIDEAFLDLSGFSHENLTDYGCRICSAVKQWTGIPVSVGIAETKTLAKIANKTAKKSPETKGVLDLTVSSRKESALAATKVSDIWGKWVPVPWLMRQQVLQKPDPGIRSLINALLFIRQTGIKSPKYRKFPDS